MGRGGQSERLAAPKCQAENLRKNPNECFHALCPMVPAQGERFVSVRSVRLQRGRDAAGRLRLRREMLLQSRVCRAAVRAVQPRAPLLPPLLR